MTSNFFAFHVCYCTNSCILCWICQGVSASAMTYIVPGGALNSTHSLTNWAHNNIVFDLIFLAAALVAPALCVSPQVDAKQSVLTDGAR